jgi:hypothetical protein
MDMLAEVLRRAVLTERERESFTDMWDRISRYKRCSDKQAAWIEKVYFGQKLGQEAPTAVRRRVVVPTWQKGEHQVTPRMEAVAPQKAPASAASIMDGSTRSVASRQVLVPKRLSSKSGTFMMLPPPKPVEAQGAQIGYINYPGINGEALVTSLTMLEELCPRITRGSKQYQKIAAFFGRGGMVLRVKPVERASQVA